MSSNRHPATGVHRVPLAWRPGYRFHRLRVDSNDAFGGQTTASEIQFRTREEVGESGTYPCCSFNYIAHVQEFQDFPISLS